MARPVIPVWRGDAVLLSKLTSDYVLWMGVTGNTRKTCAQYSRACGQFLGYLQHKQLPDDIRQFTPQNIEGFARYLAERANIGSTIGTKLSMLAGFAKWAMRQTDSRGNYLLKENPLQRVERPKKVRKSRPFLYREEMKAFRGVQAQPFEALPRDLFIDTGLRVGEIAAANVEDLWSDAGGTTYLRVRVKGGDSKETPLDPELVERLKDWLLARGLPAGREPLLTNSKGRRWTETALYELIRRLALRAGITRAKIGPHTIRHTYNVVSRMEAKLDVATRAQLLNHRDTSTVQKYDHVLDEEMVAARAAVRAAMGRYAQ